MAGLPRAKVAVQNATATLDLNGFSETIGGLYGAGQVTNSAAAAVVLGISGAGDFSGQLIDG